uniref:Complement C1q-like protein 4 isoform X3 n=1 Tax=Crassostrea virginica TaxID=6565 RepID=A0A8B8BAF6_CRAVI|nr:complement C1q-like protein 4 isoform X3 [Crassostrea virginica]
MKYTLVFCVILGIVECVLGITEDEIDRILETKMQKVIQKYDKKIALLEEKIHAQDVKIQNLEKKCSNPTMDAAEHGENASVQQVSLNRANDTGIHSKRQASSSQETLKRSFPTGTSGHVAFCAHMAASEHSPSLHHIILFDIVKTNIGSAYNKNSGMFTAPADGVYTFTWTIFSGYYSYVYTQIVVNSNAFDSMIVNSEEVGDMHSGTKLIVVSLTRGDVVYVRTDDTYLSHGDLYSGRVNGYSSFCGWKL